MAFFLGSVFALVLVMDPFGNIPLFIAALKKVAPERRMKVLLRELLIALAIILAFMIGGNTFLKILQIENYSMMISGGIVLFMISIDLIFSSPDPAEHKTDPKEDEPFIVPLAIPLVAGPAVLSFTLILTSQAPSYWVMLAVILVAAFINMIVLMLSFPISNLLGKRGLIAIEKLSGMILVVISVNMIMNGIAEFMGK